MTAIDLYYWPTPNGKKISILLEELAAPYRIIPVDILAGDQFKAEFLAISPNNKIPAIVDHDGPDGESISLFESGAIMLYLAEKFQQFMPSETHGRYDVMQWLMFQMGGVGPMLGQAHHFRVYAKEKIPYAIERYSNEAKRLYAVLNQRLKNRDYIVDDYSIADMAVLPWLLSYDKQGIDLAVYPHVQAWMDRLQARPAVQRGIVELVGESLQADQLSSAERSTLFGARQWNPHK